MSNIPDHPAKSRQQEFRGFACNFYGRTDVSRICLQLQDEAGADVLILLYVVWLGATGGYIDGAKLRCAIDDVAALQYHLIAPLRAARRALSRAAPEIPLLLATVDRLRMLEFDFEMLETDRLADLRGRISHEQGPDMAPALAEAMLAAYLNLLSCDDVQTRATIRILVDRLVCGDTQSLEPRV